MKKTKLFFVTGVLLGSVTAFYAKKNPDCLNEIKNKVSKKENELLKEFSDSLINKKYKELFLEKRIRAKMQDSMNESLNSYHNLDIEKQIDKKTEDKNMNDIELPFTEKEWENFPTCLKRQLSSNISLITKIYEDSRSK